MPLTRTPPSKTFSRRRDAAAFPQPEGWDWHFRALVALRNHLEQEARARRLQAGEAGDPGPGGKTVVDADRFDRDFVRALLANERDPLDAVNAAIKRIFRGNYGVCEATGRLIPPPRLRATPWLIRLESAESASCAKGAALPRTIDSGRSCG